jgi:hypothetical protein
MNELEQECIILNSAWDMINGMANWAMFCKHDRTDNVTMMFETRQHQVLFSILLGDFLSPFTAFKGQPVPLGLKAAPSNARPSDLTFLYYLGQVCSAPQLGDDVAELKLHTNAFATWLEAEFTAPQVNIHNVGSAMDIVVTRCRYLKICGDVSKHNLGRLATNVSHIQKLFERAGHKVTEQDAYLAVESFYDWFFDDIYVYHASVIAEHLNNLRWAIYRYLQPEYRRAWHSTGIISGAQMYAYNVPATCTEPLARAMYWDVMNRVRAGPWMQQFSVSDSFRAYY